MDSQIWTRRPVVGSSQLRGWPCGCQWMLDQTVKNSRQPGVRWSLSQSEINFGGVKIKKKIYIYLHWLYCTSGAVRARNIPVWFNYCQCSGPHQPNPLKVLKFSVHNKMCRATCDTRGQLKVKGKILIWRGTGTTERRREETPVSFMSQVGVLNYLGTRGRHEYTEAEIKHHLFLTTVFPTKEVIYLFF